MLDTGHPQLPHALTPRLLTLTGPHERPTPISSKHKLMVASQKDRNPHISSGTEHFSGFVPILISLLSGSCGHKTPWEAEVKVGSITNEWEDTITIIPIVKDCENRSLDPCYPKHISNTTRIKSPGTFCNLSLMCHPDQDYKREQQSSLPSQPMVPLEFKQWCISDVSMIYITNQMWIVNVILCRHSE